MIIMPGELLAGKRRKRKRHRTDDDCVSLHSVDLSLDEPKKRRRSSLARMSSLTNLLSPIKPVKKVRQALQKSLSLRNLMSPSAPAPSPSKYTVTPYKKPAPTPPKRRDSCFWYETVETITKQSCTTKQIERQEAIFELYKNEEDLIDDLNMVKTTYHDSLKKLNLLSEDELSQIFGQISTLVPLHEDIVEGLRNQRLPDGTTESIGSVIVSWVPRLREYIPYCSNQVYAKALLDDKKHDPAVDDFLQRCQDSPFSRRLDLWSFLDIPRSRLVKYPLLFRNIQKLTPPDHPDIALLDEACAIVADIIAQVDQQTGECKCAYTRDKLEYLDDKQHDPLIDESRVILCDGTLKNTRGTKLQVFLFEKVLVLARVATRGHQMRYQVYRQPIPIADLLLEELADGSHGKSGSFRSAFSNAQHGNNSFRVSLRDGAKGHTHTLQANDPHDKRQWLSSLRAVLPPENIIEPEHSDEENRGKKSGSFKDKDGESKPTKSSSFKDKDGEHKPTKSSSFKDKDGEHKPSKSSSFKDKDGEHKPTKSSSFKDKEHKLKTKDAKE